MLLKLLGTADILALTAMILATYLPQTLVIIMALYLIIKGLIFAVFGDPISLVDIFGGIYIFYTAFNPAHWIITLIFTAFILQKSIISILS